MRRPLAVIELLSPIFCGDWASYGEGVQLAPECPPGAIVLADLVQRPAVLRAILERRAAMLRCEDLRPVASAWVMRYLALLLPPVMAAATVLRRVFPLAVDRVSISLDEEGNVRVFHLPHLGDVRPDAGAPLRYGSLMDDHLAPLFAAIVHGTRLPQKILWSNAARRLATLFDEAIPRLDEPAVAAVDRAWLLETPCWGASRANPMYASPDNTVLKAQGGDKVHRDCCLNYRLPGEGYCGACPLDQTRGAWVQWG